jgi:hypothetical protein
MKVVLLVSAIRLLIFLIMCYLGWQLGNLLRYLCKYPERKRQKLLQERTHKEALDAEVDKILREEFRREQQKETP